MKHFLNTSALFLICNFLFLATVNAQGALPAQANNDPIDIFIRKVMKGKNIPGLQLAVIRHGKIIKATNYGMANIEQSIPTVDQSVFSINSVTKAFVGVAIMQLSEDGKLNINDPLSKYIDSLPPAWQKITIQQVLTNSSGLPDIIDAQENVIGNGTEQSAWEKVKQLPMEFKTGEKFSYNQTGYVIIGKIINQLSGMHFTQFIESRQFQTAGMRSTRFGDSFDIIPNDAGAYSTVHNVNGRWVNNGPLGKAFMKFPVFFRTATGIISTASDMANWIIALQNGKLLKDKMSLQTLWSPAKLNNGRTGGFSDVLNGYALGFPTIERAEHPAVAPVGGMRSAFFIYPKDDLSIIILTNLMGANPESFTDKIAAYYIPDMLESNGFGLSPSVKILRSALIKQGFDQAVGIAAVLKKKDAAFDLKENDLNAWGYRLLGEKKNKEAMAIFKLNVSLYPKSGNTYDSLAELQDNMGDKENAVKNYKHAIELNPGNKNAVEQLKRLQGK